MALEPMSKTATESTAMNTKQNESEDRNRDTAKNERLIFLRGFSVRQPTLSLPFFAHLDQSEREQQCLALHDPRTVFVAAQKAPTAPLLPI
jgi:hypothetical protein